jgi:zinc-binding in reverse transcriptase
MFGDDTHQDFFLYTFYDWLKFRGVISTDYDVIWKSKIPFKIKIFIWLVRRQKILTTEQLAKKAGKEILLVFFVELLKITITCFLFVL